MTTYYLVQRNETFAIITDESDTVTHYCGPLDSSDMPQPGESIDLTTWHYDDGAYPDLDPWRPDVAILAIQDATEPTATCLYDAYGDDEDA